MSGDIYDRLYKTGLEHHKKQHKAQVSKYRNVIKEEDEKIKRTTDALSNRTEGSHEVSTRLYNPEITGARRVQLREEKRLEAVKSKANMYHGKSKSLSTEDELNNQYQQALKYMENKQRKIDAHHESLRNACKTKQSGPCRSGDQLLKASMDHWKNRKNLVLQDKQQWKQKSLPQASSRSYGKGEIQPYDRLFADGLRRSEFQRELNIAKVNKVRHARCGRSNSLASIDTEWSDNESSVYELPSAFWKPSEASLFNL